MDGPKLLPVLDHRAYSWLGHVFLSCNPGRAFWQEGMFTVGYSPTFGAR